MVREKNGEWESRDRKGRKKRKEKRVGKIHA